MNKFFSSLFAVALFGVGIAFAIPSTPAEAGQRNDWRSCGGSRYEGCNPPRSMNRNRGKQRFHGGNLGFQNRQFQGQQNFGQAYNRSSMRTERYEFFHRSKVTITKRQIHIRCDRNGCSEM